MALIVTFEHLRWRARDRKLYTWIGLDVLFIAGFLLCHFSIPFMLAAGAMGFDELRSGRIIDGTVAINISSSYSLLALITFSLFFRVFFQKYSTRKVKAGKCIGKFELSVLFRVSCLLIFFGFTSFLFFVFSQRDSYLSGSYSGLHNIDERYENLRTISHMLLIAGSSSLVIFSIKRYNGLHPKIWLGLSLILIYIVLQTIHGGRGVVVQILSAIGASYFLFKRVSLRMLLVGILVSLPILHVIIIARSTGDRSLGLIWEVASESNEEIGISGLIKGTVLNVGSSGLLTGVAVEHAKEKGSMRGVYATEGIFALVPFSRRQLHNHVFSTSSTERESSRLLTWLVNAHHNWGVGTTTVAEAYLDFGLFGVIYSHFFLAFIAGFFEGMRWSRSEVLLVLVAYCVCVSIFVIGARYGVFASVIRSLGYPLLAYWGLTKCVRVMS